MKILFVLRSIIGGILFLFNTLLCSLAMTVFNHQGWQRKAQNCIIYFWSHSALVFFGVNLEIKGLEKIEAGSGLLLFNHSSFFDIFVIFAAFQDFRFGAKIELFKIPFFGAAMRRAGVLPIARQNREEVFKVYEEAKTRAEDGEKFALAPEGGRNRDGRLLPFKSGPFIFAINSQMPLIPTVIQGAFDVMKKGSAVPNSDAWSKKIRVSFLDPIPVAGMTLSQREILQQKSFTAMSDYIAKNPL